MTNSNLTTEQKEQLKQIGMRLQNVRIARNITLDTVAAHTKIAKSLLSAIEVAEFSDLPEPFYIKALVAKFAQAIGAPEIEFVQSAVPDIETVKTRTTKKNGRKYWLNFQLRSLHLYLLYVFLVIFSVKGITLLVERPVVINQVPLEQPLESEIEEAVAPTEPEQPQFVSQSSTPESVTVGINLQEECWLKVMVDGKLAFEGLLPQGTQRQWSGKTEVTIRAGNAGGVVINFNNEQQKVLGAPGQVEEITYTLN